MLVNPNRAGSPSRPTSSTGDAAAPSTSTTPVHDPAVHATAAAPAATRTDGFAASAPTSGLGAWLARHDAGHAGVAELVALSKDAAQLSAARPREAQRAIEALQAGPTTRAEEEAIVAILHALPLKVRGECIRLLDGGADAHTVGSLVSADIDDRALRAQAEALIAAARPWAASSGSFVISDIDDTVKPHKAPSPDARAFPGVATLFRALDVGPQGTDSSGDVHFVTARDGFFVRGQPSLRRAGVDIGSVRHSGDVVSGALSLFGRTRGVEDDKVRNITDLIDRNPSRKAILFGDNVQADPRVFVRVLAARPDGVSVALVHEVEGYTTPPEANNDPRIVRFSDYADAARQLHARGLISAAQRDAVVAEVTSADARIPPA